MFIGLGTHTVGLVSLLAHPTLSGLLHSPLFPVSRSIIRQAWRLSHFYHFVSGGRCCRSSPPCPGLQPVSRPPFPAIDHQSLDTHLRVVSEPRNSQSTQSACIPLNAQRLFPPFGILNVVLPYTTLRALDISRLIRSSYISGPLSGLAAVVIILFVEIQARAGALSTYPNPNASRPLFPTIHLVARSCWRASEEVVCISTPSQLPTKTH
ncbi:hypothetical protein V8F20_000954 [Naviculisporaceae sp. PSN 640]